LLLEICLHSVEKAAKDILHEIIVVDNKSTDGSCDYLSYLFPHVKIIFNDKNLGFAKACNQGLKISSGNNVLFLNPDTIWSRWRQNDRQGRKFFKRIKKRCADAGSIVL
jgi:GT2 family glycosyltransferase